MSELAMLKKFLDQCECKTCSGSGTCDNAELGDIYFETWICSSCKGTGIGPDIDHRLMLERVIRTFKKAKEKRDAHTDEKDR